MKNKDFDDILKHKISQNETSNTNSDWDAFSKILKQSEGFENLDFDQVVEEKITDHKVPFNSSHWALLKSRLLKEEYLRNKILSIKSLETIVLLLFLLLFQQYNIDRLEKEISNEPLVINQAFNTSSSSATSKTNSTSKIKAAFDRRKAEITKNNTVTNITSTKNKKIEVKEVEKQIDQVNATPVANQKYETLTAINLIHKNINSLYKSNSISNALNDIANKIDNKAINSSNILKSSPTKPVTSMNVNVENINQPFGGTAEEVKLPFVGNDVANVQKFITPTVFSGVGITKSPFDPIYNFKSYSTLSSQYGIGMLYSVKDKNLELQSGLRYTKRTHKPAAIVETYGNLLGNYSQISLNKISYDIIEIPLNLKYHFKENAKTRIYAQAGINTNISLKNSYEIIKKPVASSSLAKSGAANFISDNTLVNNEREAKLSKKEFNKGFFQGGKIKDNFFLTLSAGVGMERQLSQKNALSLGIEYNKFYMIDGIGPNKDKLNGVAINFGLKHQIN
jgi:opacity protein-like surface antigen